MNGGWHGGWDVFCILHSSFPLGRRKLKRTWGVVYLHGRRLPLAEETFVGLSRTVTEGYGE
jgi:hypothetical protein